MSMLMQTDDHLPFLYDLCQNANNNARYDDGESDDHLPFLYDQSGKDITIHTIQMKSGLQINRMC